MKKAFVLLTLMVSSCGLVENDCGSKEVVISLFTQKGIRVENYSVGRRNGFCVHDVSFRGRQVSVVYYKDMYIIGTIYDGKGKVLHTPTRPIVPLMRMRLQGPPQTQTPLTEQK